MFTVKKTKDGIIVDPEKPHSTADIHYFITGKGATQHCNLCKKAVKDGEVCGLVSIGGKMVVEHERCPK